MQNLFKFSFVCLDWNSHQTLEAPPAATEEGVADWPTCATVLTRVGNTSRYFHLTAPSGVLGLTGAREPQQTDRRSRSLRIQKIQFTVYKSNKQFVLEITRHTHIHPHLHTRKWHTLIKTVITLIAFIAHKLYKHGDTKLKPHLHDSPVCGQYTCNVHVDGVRITTLEEAFMKAPRQPNDRSQNMFDFSPRPALVGLPRSTTLIDKVSNSEAEMGRA